MALDHMSHFMGQNARNLVGALRLFDQAAKQQNMAAGRRGNVKSCVSGREGY